MKLEIVNHHYFVRIDGRVALIDMGSPMSFALEDVCISLGEQNYDVCANPSIIASVNNSGLLGEAKIDILLGTDILEKHCIALDKRNDVCYIDGDFDLYGMHVLPVNMMKMMGQGYVIAKAKINGTEQNFILDTGAWIGYATTGVLGASPEIGEIDDYNPILGDIHTTKHNIELEIAGCHILEHPIGRMPDLLAMALGLLDIEVVMGIDDIAEELIIIDLANARVAFK